MSGTWRIVFNPTETHMRRSEKQWFAMRDLTRRNANVMAHHLLREAGLEVFTPMQQIIMTVRGRKQRRDVPVIQDLLFVHESKEVLDSRSKRPVAPK